MTHLRHHALALVTLIALTACSGAQPTPDPDPTADSTTDEGTTDTTADAKKGDAEKATPESTPRAAAMTDGPFADFDAYAKASGVTLLAVDPGEDATGGEWVAEIYMVRQGEQVRQIMLAGKAGALYLMPTEGEFLADTVSHTPDQYKGRAIVRESSLPPGYVLFEHIVEFIDETQSGQAHEVLGFSHLCRPHNDGFACARFTTKRGGYLIYDGDDGGYEMPNAVVKDADGAENLVELFYMNGGKMDEPGFYSITLP